MSWFYDMTVLEQIVLLIGASWALLTCLSVLIIFLRWLDADDREDIEFILSMEDFDDDSED